MTDSQHCSCKGADVGAMQDLPGNDNARFLFVNLLGGTTGHFIPTIAHSIQDRVCNAE